MGFLNSIQVLRRRLLILVAGLVLGVGVGWLTAPGVTHRATAFRATHTLIYEPQGTQNYNIEQVALLANAGAVPGRVAVRLKMDRSQVRSAVSAVADGSVSTIAITARSADAAKAVSLADVTAEELGAEIIGQEQATYQAEVSRLSAAAASARDRLNGSRTPADQTAARADVDAADRALQQYEQSPGPPKPQLRTLESAVASPVGATGVRAPNSKKVRAILLGVLGLLIGVGAAFALDRLDSRIRTKSEAEEAFGVPVVAEVPPIAKSSQGQLLARTQPSSSFVESYRGLRTYVALWSPEGGTDDGHRVIVVTSPAAGDGKTTTVAHLAAMLAEIGRSVVVISGDLRRPQLHHYFDRQAAPGLVDIVAATPGAPAFDDLDLATPVRGVRLVTSGPPVDNPAPLLEFAGELVRAARGLAEFVLVDSPPLLVANDAAELARHADGVLLVARAGRTLIEAAERSTELLQRLEIPVVGVVLTASEAAATASRYYASHYYSEADRAGWRRRRPSGGNGQRPAEGAPLAPEKAPPAVGGP